MLDNRRDPRVPIIDEVCGLDNYEMISHHRLVSLLPARCTDYYMHID
jgi:hypothetical protein